MMHIDVHTIIIILIIGNLVSLFLFTVQGAESRLPASDKYYLAGRIMQSCAWALIAFSAGFPNSMPYRSGGVILVAGFAAEALAMLSPLIAVQAWLRRLILLLPLIALINILNPADLGSGTVTGLEAVIFAFPFFISGFILCTGWNDLSRQSRMTGILNLLCSLFLLARAIVFLGSGDELSVPYYVHVAAVMVFFMLLTVSSISYILITRESFEQSLMRETTTDYLTGVSNRRGFETDAEKYISLASRISIPLSMLMIEIDNFKRINHRFGHDAGDSFLKEFASTVSRILRCYDLVCRYGGEEFVVLLPNTTAEIGKQVAERIRSYADSITLQGYRGLRCTVSVGISSAVPGDEKTIGIMYDESEAALYRAKKSGRNKVCLAPH